MISVIFVAGTIIFFNFDGTSLSKGLATLDLIPKPETMTELYFNDSANLPGSETSNQATGTYMGTIDDVSSNVSTSLSLTGVRQSQGKITGYLVLGPGLRGSGSFSGTIDTTNHLQLTVTDLRVMQRSFLQGRCNRQPV